MNIIRTFTARASGLALAEVCVDPAVLGQLQGLRRGDVEALEDLLIVEEAAQARDVSFHDFLQRLAARHRRGRRLEERRAWHQLLYAWVLILAMYDAC